jgi:hypothetical protein
MQVEKKKRLIIMRIWNMPSLFGIPFPKQWNSMRPHILQNLKAALNGSNIFRYEIRTNPSFVVTPSTTELYSSPASCRESVGHWSGVFPIETGESCPVNQYYYSGFVAIQALFDFTKIRVSLSTYVSPSVCGILDVSLMKKQFVITH